MWAPAGKVYENGTVIPNRFHSKACLIFSNGIIKEGDEICAWTNSGSIVTGILMEITHLKLTLRICTQFNLFLNCEYITDIAKKVDGEWILMEVNDGE